MPEKEEEEKQPYRLYVRHGSVSSEQFFGAGSQYSRADLKGLVVPIFLSEQGIGRGVQPLTGLLNRFGHGAGGSWSTTYTAVPFLVGVDGGRAARGFFLEGTPYGVFDLSAADAVESTVVTTVPHLQGRLVSGPTMRDVVGSFTRHYAGLMPPLPQWAWSEGAVLGLEGGTAAVEATVAKVLAANVSLAGVWLQDWTGLRTDAFGSRLWWNWEVDRTHYPDWEGMCARLRARGVRVLTYINPFLVDVSSKPDGYQRNLFREAADRGFLVRNATNDPYLMYSGTPDFIFAMVDLAYPPAAAWYRDVIATQVLNGTTVSGFMADFGEYLPFDAVTHSGVAGLDTHNGYPGEWARVVRSAVPDDAVAFHRSGSPQSPASARLFWMGDQLTSWDEYDGLRSALAGLLSAGLSGWALAHSDIGGYTEVDEYGVKYIRKQELLLRWMETSALADAFFRTHPGLRPDVAAQVYDDNTSLAHFARFSKIHAALGNYRNAVMTTPGEGGPEGLPLTRIMALEFPNDPNATTLRGQFMLGPWLLAAPVLDKGVAAVPVYLPANTTWQSVWNHAVQVDTDADAGTYHTFKAPLGCPPLFFLAQGGRGTQDARLRARRLLQPLFDQAATANCTTTLVY